MEKVLPSRKETHKKSKKLDMFFKFFKILLDKILIPTFISLATFAYITNNYSSILKYEKYIDELEGKLTNSFTYAKAPGSENIEDFHFSIEDTYQDNSNYVLVLKIWPENKEKSSDDYYALVNNQGRKINLNNVKLMLDQNTDLTTSYIINIYTNKGILVDNSIQLESTFEFEEKIRALIEQKPKSKLAKLFLDTFK